VRRSAGFTRPFAVTRRAPLLSTGGAWPISAAGTHLRPRVSPISARQCHDKTWRPRRDLRDGYRNAVICDAILEIGREGRRVRIEYWIQRLEEGQWTQTRSRCNSYVRQHPGKTSSALAPGGRVGLSRGRARRPGRPNGQRACAAALDVVGPAGMGAHVPFELRDGTGRVVAEHAAPAASTAIRSRRCSRTGAATACARWKPPNSSNHWGERCGRAGLRFGFHKPRLRVRPARRRHPVRSLWETPTVALVALELDLFWAHDAGVDPVSLFLFLLGHVGAGYHSYTVKDREAGDEARRRAGRRTGILPWDRLLEASAAGEGAVVHRRAGFFPEPWRMCAAPPVSRSVWSGARAPWSVGGKL
jgi:hypothetical protein